jgi:patatin-like phospholipase/acyl hydrolase
MKHIRIVYLLYILVVAACTVCFAPAVAAATGQSAPNKKFRILSIDGGGIRGIISARILQAIEETTGKPIHKLFDLIVGSSTGGLLALGVVAPGEQGLAKFKAKDIVDFYRYHGPRIFHAPFLYRLSTVWGLYGPKYRREYLDTMLKDLLGEARLSQTLKPTLVLTYSLEESLPHVWSTQGAREGLHPDFYLYDMAGATTAAPTYFAPKVLESPKGSFLHEIDGGVWANNPAVVAAVALQNMHFPVHNSNDVLVVSIGTSLYQPNKELYAKELTSLNKAGIIGWALRGTPNIIQIMLGASSVWSKMTVAAFYPHNYRLQIAIPETLSSIDDADNLEPLYKLTESYLSRSTNFGKVCDLLSQLADE